MILYEKGIHYWAIARRFHQHRTAPLMRATAVRDMRKLRSETQSPAVLKRVNSFIARHQSPPPGISPNGSGPRRA
jgi:hypothetical protein